MATVGNMHIAIAASDFYAGQLVDDSYVININSDATVINAVVVDCQAHEEIEAQAIATALGTS